MLVTRIVDNYIEMTRSLPLFCHIFRSLLVPSIDHSAQSHLLYIFKYDELLSKFINRKVEKFRKCIFVCIFDRISVQNKSFKLKRFSTHLISSQQNPIISLFSCSPQCPQISKQWHLFTHSFMSKWTKVEDRENLKKYSVCTRNKTSFSVNSVAYAFSQCLYWKSGSVRNSPIFISIIFVNAYFQQILFISTGKSTIFLFICYIF